MKILIKQTIGLIIVTLATGFQSCESNDEPEEPTPTNIDFSKKDAVVGKWFQTLAIFENGSSIKSEDKSMTFNADGTFEYRFGSGGMYSVKGTYTYLPLSKDKGIAYGERAASGGVTYLYTFTFENYSEYRYKVKIQQPDIIGTGSDEHLGIFGCIN